MLTATITRDFGVSGEADSRESVRGCGEDPWGRPRAGSRAGSLAGEAQSPARPSLVTPGPACVPPQPRSSQSSVIPLPGQGGAGPDAGRLPLRHPPRPLQLGRTPGSAPAPVACARLLLLPLLPLGNSLPHLFLPARSPLCGGARRGGGSRDRFGAQRSPTPAAPPSPSHPEPLVCRLWGMAPSAAWPLGAGRGRCAGAAASWGGIEVPGGLTERWEHGDPSLPPCTFPASPLSSRGAQQTERRGPQVSPGDPEAALPAAPVSSPLGGCGAQRRSRL